jgi:hypothetical protein
LARKAVCGVNMFDKRIWEKRAMARQLQGYRSTEIAWISRLQVGMGDWLWPDQCY